jgi:actin-related protein 6
MGRLNVGGKFLTNYLKETISFRQLNMMDETHLMNQVKEACCFVSMDVPKDLMLAKRHDSVHLQHYVLPDFSSQQQGYIWDASKSLPSDMQMLKMNNERFQVPELLFHPSDIGLMQGGLGETIQGSIEACPQEMQPYLWANVVLVGGCAHLPGFKERVQMELQGLAPGNTTVRVALPANPTTFAWQGAQALVSTGNTELLNMASKQDYFEQGSTRIQHAAFNTWSIVV